VKVPILTRSPLKACLTVLKFSSIELMGESYIPLIQDRYRKEGLPVFEIRRVEELSPVGEKEKQTLWLFSDFNKSNMVIIGKGSFGYQTFNYNHFNDFQDKLLLYFEIFAQLTEFYRHNILEFIGLRYINAIEGEKWRLYLTEPYRGINFPEGVLDARFYEFHALYAQGTTSIGSEHRGSLVIKTLQNNEGLLFPPDILLLEQQTEKKGNLVTVLDIDHFSLLKTNLSDSSFVRTMSSTLHEACEKVFFNAITEEALRLWS